MISVEYNRRFKINIKHYENIKTKSLKLLAKQDDFKQQNLRTEKKYRYKSAGVECFHCKQEILHRNIHNPY